MDIQRSHAKLYLGVKMIRAIPMSRQEYNDYRGWELPDDEFGSDQGYLVEYVDGGKPNDPRHEGYISWSPRDVFDRAYRPVERMTFGQAIEALKEGKRVARAGWNGKGMWLWLNKGVFDGELMGFHDGTQPGMNHTSTIDGVRLGLFEAHLRGSHTRLPNINMRAASGATVTGWLASQTDMLAEDWEIL
jgi:hypothetical protein